MSTERPTQSDQELWQSLATDRAVAPAAVSDLDFAAWLEGRLPEAAAARIEAAVAADPEMRRAALELADILGMPLPAAPARLEVRAQALVGFEVERAGAARVGLFDWLFARAGASRCSAWRRCTAAVVIAISGFMLGGGLGEIDGPGALRQRRHRKPSPDTANELNEFLVSDGI